MTRNDWRGPSSSSTINNVPRRLGKMTGSASFSIGSAVNAMLKFSFVRFLLNYYRKLYIRGGHAQVKKTYFSQFRSGKGFAGRMRLIDFLQKHIRVVRR